MIKFQAIYSDESGAKQVLMDLPIGIEENLIGAQDGVNKIFTTSEKYIAATTEVYFNGLKQIRGLHYAESGEKQITLDDAPTNYELRIKYYKAI